MRLTAADVGWSPRSAAGLLAAWLSCEHAERVFTWELNRVLHERCVAEVATDWMFEGWTLSNQGCSALPHCKNLSSNGC